MTTELVSHWSGAEPGWCEGTGCRVTQIQFYDYCYCLSPIHIKFRRQDIVLHPSTAQLLNSVSLICKQIFCRSGDITDCAIRFMQANIIKIDT